MPPAFKLKQLPWPMALTTLRLLLVPVFLCLLVFAAPVRTGLVPSNPSSGDRFRYAALGVFILMAITDKLDGTLARKLHQVTRLGTLLDPLADKLLVTGCFVLLIFPRFAPAGFAIPWPVFWGVCQKDVCVVIGAAIVKSQVGKVEINANRWGKLNTLVEITLVLATLLAPQWIAISPAFAAMLLWLLWHLTVLATAASAIGYSIDGARQLRAAAGMPAETKDANS